MMILYLLLGQSIVLLACMGVNTWVAYELRKLSEALRDVASHMPQVHLHFDGGERDAQEPDAR